jgi:hypothetical protein
MNSTSQEYFKSTVKTIPNDIPQLCFMVTMSKNINIPFKYSIYTIDIGRVSYISEIKVGSEDFKLNDICDAVKNLSVIKDYDLSIIFPKFYENADKVDILEDHILNEGLLLLNIASIVSIHNAEEDDTIYDVKFMNGEFVTCEIEEIKNILQLCEQKGRYDLLL